MRVERACQHAHECEQHFVLGWAASFIPFIVFGTEHSFMRKQIGISACDAGGLPDAVEIDGQMMPSRRLNHGCVEAHHLLIVAVEKVEHDSRNSPALVE